VTTDSALLPTAPAILFAVASLIDIAFLSARGSPDAAPLPVIILFALLGAITLVALVPARRVSQPVLSTAVAMRVISALLAFVSFFADVPLWVMIGEAIVIVIVVALIIPRRRPTLAVSA
jgi:hypothetical protein